MSLSIVQVVLLVLVSFALMFYAFGWKTSLLNSLYAIGVAVVYTLVVKFFGQQGKEYFAYSLVFIALVIMAIRRRNSNKKL